MIKKPLLPFLGNDDHLRQILILIGYMVIVGGLAIAAVIVWPSLRWSISVVSPLLVAMVVAYIVNPVVSFVQHRLRLSRIWGVVLVNLMVVGAAAILVAIILPILIMQVRSASEGIRVFARDRAVPWVIEQIGGGNVPSADLAINVSESISEWIPEEGIAVEELEARIDAVAESDEGDVVWTKDADLLASAIRTWLAESDKEQVEREALRTWLVEQAEQWREVEGSRRLSRRVEEWVDSRELTFESVVESALANEQLRSAARSAAAGGAGFVGWLVASLVVAIQWLVSSTMFLSFVAMLTFYLLIDFASLRGAMEVICPPKWRARFFDVLDKADVAVGGFIRGQLTVAFLVGLLATIGLFLLGMKQYALLIGVIAGMGNLIPFFGPVIGGTPALLYVLFSESYSEDRLLFLGLTLGWFVMIQTLEGLVFQPYIVGSAARLHPVVVIMAVVIGVQFGFIGALLALPATCIVRVLLKEFFWDTRLEEWQRSTGRRRLDDLPNAPRKKTNKKAK
jgi:predicted PurR-regulated permease PerM